MPTKTTQPAKRAAKGRELIRVDATIPPHVANVLMRYLKAKTPQEAVDQILAIYTEPRRNKKGKS